MTVSETNLTSDTIGARETRVARIRQTAKAFDEGGMSLADLVKLKVHAFDVACNASETQHEREVAADIVSAACYVEQIINGETPRERWLSQPFSV